MGLFRDGNSKELVGQTLAIEEGEKIYLTIRDTGFSTVCISIFDLCAESATLLSTERPSGRELRQKESYIGKVDFTGKLVGSAMA